MQDQIENTDVLLDTGQVAMMLGVSHFYVQAHSSGKRKPTIPFLKLSHRTLRFKLGDVREFIASRSKKS